MSTIISNSYTKETEEGEKLTQKIRFFQRESRLLIDQLSKLKIRLNDTVLPNMAHNSSTYNATSHPNYKSYQTLKGHFNKVLALSWHPDNRHVLSASQDGFMIMWDSVTGLKTGIRSLEDPWVSCCDISPNGKLVASAGLDNNCYIYKIDGFMSNAVDNANNSDSSDSSDNSPTSHMDNKYNPQNNNNASNKSSLISIMKGHKEYISDCGFISNSKILTTSGDKTCNLWDINKGMKVTSFVDHLGDVLALSINKVPNEFNTTDRSLYNQNTLSSNIKDNTTFDITDGNGKVSMFATCGSDGLVNIWDIRQESHVRQYQISESFDSSAIKFLPNGYSIACGCDDGQIKLFDLRSDSQVSNYKPQQVVEYMNARGTGSTLSHTQTMGSFSGGGYMNSYNRSGNLSDRDTVSNNSLPQRIQREIYQSIDNPGVLSFDFSKSSRYMYVSYNDYADLLVWDVMNAKVIDNLSGHQNVNSKVRVSNDGEGICTASRDNTLRVWSSY